ncbi:MAG TPA: exosortase E/protease, VPEID-CTERM system, partial [Bryobacteraceae bacterium]|nr:exosortase E/protease, VPEID-CTERM system [Bryobacteraceae bacterium]
MRNVADLPVAVEFRWRSSTFCQRLILLAGLMLAEWLPISAAISTGSGGQATARGVSAFFALFLCFGYFRARDTFSALIRSRDRIAFSLRFLGLHGFAMGAFLALSMRLMSAAAGHSVWLTFAWFVLAACGVVCSALAFIPGSLWMALLRATGNLWAYALPASVMVARMVSVLWSLWNGDSWPRVTGFTFGLVEFVLRRLRPDLIANRATLTVGDSRFMVRIGDACSGLEGAGLILAFSLIWVWLFRRECRFPHALVVIPAGMAAMFASNVLRIVALVLIGMAGAPAIAVGGFHSQAGWIAFNGVALALAFTAPRIRWLRAGASEAPFAVVPALNPSVPYLLPFACILAAGMLSRAASGEFEWLYPLRFFSAAAALWFCRRAYSKLNWRPTWMGLLAGIGVFALWMALDHGAAGHGPSGALMAQLPVVRILWIVFRALAATTTVPVAEELAFRGFLARRVVAPDFESVDFRRLTLPAVLVSSVVFGLMH